MKQEIISLGVLASCPYVIDWHEKLPSHGKISAD
jgi:hypothetical protein